MTATATGTRTQSPTRTPPRRQSPGASLADEMRLLGRCQRRILERIGDLERRQAYRADGSTSMVSWVMEHLSIGYPSARDYVSVAAELPRLPALAEGLSSGTVSFDQLRCLVRVATPADDAELAAHAAAWSLAQTESHVRLEETRRADAARRRAEEARRAAAASAASLVGADAPSPDAAPGAASPATAPAPADHRCAGLPGVPALLGAPRPGTLRLRPHASGGTLEGWLPAEDFAAVESALVALAKAVERDPLSGAFIPLAERLATALVDLVGADHAATNPAGRRVPSVVVHCDVGLLANETDGSSVGVVEGVGPVSAEIVRHLACDAQLRLALETDGVTLDLGRSRRTPSMRLVREILRRDVTCRFPGCGARRFLQVHHVAWWEHGGPTDLDNLAAHCARDHRRIHHGGWRVEGHANAELRYTSPEGRTLVSMPDPAWAAPRSRRSTDRPQR